ncbi:hypothetical protein BHE74_00020196 [Ensete ventricosum]|uniref:Uncharacterized protein n=1 Tax=Ensete ventricosum TaxID=4639 RepID=A0A445MIQ5_ENSVE|nr:hypothetical protein BHE74_00020196 [Ensete ventricosum]RZR74145.1 hypothetical protein BHM03_00032497 [Ensete ventricosum]
MLCTRCRFPNNTPAEVSQHQPLSSLATLIASHTLLCHHSRLHPAAVASYCATEGWKAAALAAIFHRICCSSIRRTSSGIALLHSQQPRVTDRSARVVEAVLPYL